MASTKKDLSPLLADAAEEVLKTPVQPKAVFVVWLIVMFAIFVYPNLYPQNGMPCDKFVIYHDDPRYMLIHDMLHKL